MELKWNGAALRLGTALDGSSLVGEGGGEGGGGNYSRRSWAKSNFVVPARSWRLPLGRAHLLDTHDRSSALLAPQCSGSRAPRPADGPADPRARRPQPNVRSLYGNTHTRARQRPVRETGGRASPSCDSRLRAPTRVAKQRETLRGRKLGVLARSSLLVVRAALRSWCGHFAA